jgi:hypothetical protein
MNDLILILATSGLSPQRETCKCRACRSDMAYIVPCEYENTIEFTLIDPMKGMDNEQLGKEPSAAEAS